MDSQIRHRSHHRFFLIRKTTFFPRIDTPGLWAAVSKVGFKCHDTSIRPLSTSFLAFAWALASLWLWPIIGIACFFIALHHGLALFQRHSHRLFAENVFSCPERCDGDLGVGVVGYADADCVNLRIGEQFFIRAIRFSAILHCQFAGAPFI